MSAIKLHGPEATDASDMQALFHDMDKLMKEEGRLNDPLFPIELPNKEQLSESELLIARKEVRGKIAQLYRSGFLKLKSGKKVGGRDIPMVDDGSISVIPMGKKCNPFVAQLILEDSISNLIEIINELDVDFDQAILNRECGALKVISEVINYANKFKDPNNALYFWSKIIAPKRDEDGNEVPLYEIPWDESHLSQDYEKFTGRKKILAERLYELKFSSAMTDRDQYYQEFGKLFHDKEKEKAILMGFFKSYETICAKLGVEELRKCTLINNLLSVIYESFSKLNKKNKTEDIFDALKELEFQIQFSHDFKELREKINFFAEDTLKNLCETVA